jgi:hypothetical protein
MSAVGTCGNPHVSRNSESENSELVNFCTEFELAISPTL